MVLWTRKSRKSGVYTSEENEEIANRLRRAFASWYDNGHTNEDDTNTIILRMKIIDGIIVSEGVKYEF